MRALVIAGVGALEDQAQRELVIRVPEVSIALKEAQRCADQLKIPVDFLSLLIGPDQKFYSNLLARTLITAIVQSALLKRMLKTAALPEFLIGPANGDSAIFVATGQTDLMALVKGSQLFTSFLVTRVQPSSPRSNRNSATGAQKGGLRVVKSAELPMGGGGAPLLAGVQMTEYRIFRRAGGSAINPTYLPLPDANLDFGSLLFSSLEKYAITELINVGPGGVMTTSLFQKKLTGLGIRVEESISLDPILSDCLRPAALGQSEGSLLSL